MNKMDGQPIIRLGTVCWSCKHFHFSSGGSGYSEYTPGYEATMSCSENVWDFSFCDGGSQIDLENSLKTAERCTKFEQRKTS